MRSAEGSAVTLRTPEAGAGLSWPVQSLGLADGRAAFLEGVRRGLRPPRRITVAEWAAERRRVAAESGSPLPGRWRNEVAPYLVEIMECLSPHHPAREVVFKKSAQVAGTEAGLNLIGHTIDEAPGPILVVLPSLDEAKKYNKVKLGPTIEQTPSLRAKVLEQKSRDEDSSTTSFKRFRGGYLVLTGANSSKGLQMISVRTVIFEEISEFPFDVDGRGDPVDLALARTDAHTARRKIFYNSTPGLKGICRVSAKYEASDQRQYHVPCPHCGAEQVLDFANLRWNSDTPPHGAFYVCAVHGCIIEHRHKRAMLAAGRWIARYPGRFPGFALDQLYSPFKTWDDIAARIVAAGTDPARLKVLTQQVKGLEWEDAGDAPDWEKLYARREDWPAGTVPHGGLMIVGAADVSHDGIWYEVVAFGRGRTTWSIDAGFIEGDTAHVDAPAWRKLTEVYHRRYVAASGRDMPIQHFAVDSGDGKRARTVYDWVRGRPLALAIKGVSGRNKPAVGTPSTMTVTRSGRKTRRGLKVWPIGVDDLKAEFYAFLRIAPPTDGAEQFAPGYCHFPMGRDTRFFQQLTAEYLDQAEVKGRIVSFWRQTRPNHFLDCRVYAMAMADLLGITKMTEDRWRERELEWDTPPPEPQLDLLGPVTAGRRTTTAHGPDAGRPPPAAASPEPAEDPAAPPPTPWLGGRRTGWLGARH